MGENLAEARKRVMSLAHMTIMRLTRGNRTMREKFKEAGISTARPAESSCLPAGADSKTA